MRVTRRLGAKIRGFIETGDLAKWDAIMDEHCELIETMSGEKLTPMQREFILDKSTFLLKNYLKNPHVMYVQHIAFYNIPTLIKEIKKIDQPISHVRQEYIIKDDFWKTFDEKINKLLKKRESDYLKLYYRDNMTMQAVADTGCVSRQYVEQVLKGAIKKLKGLINGNESLEVWRAGHWNEVHRPSVFRKCV